MKQESSDKPDRSEERRVSPRTRVQIWIEEKCDNSTYFHLVSNLSESGFFIEKKLPFPVGSEVNMDIQFPGDEEKVRVRGMIVSNYIDPASNNRGAGVNFINLDIKVKEMIKKYLNEENEKQSC